MKHFLPILFKNLDFETYGSHYRFLRENSIFFSVQ